VSIAVNPYESVAQSEKPGVSVRQLAFAISLGALYTLTGLLVLLVAYLPIRYPGLSDKESGPAYYWPDDLFYLLLPVASVLLIFSTVVFIMNYLRKYHRTKTELKSTMI
jgi:O-antigen/teichoic acid export membrane protein